ncbi:hypothetical protein F2Q70_00005094 [Brassica cretica]|uniref:Uncharacterized protein n=1 Tax=Brassica cretica TaxID=69181 RepID=A0A8S9IUR8_BRACR|nr:hypothetical protein F2Q70_00005094 [Brassica cretica]
MSYRCFRRAQSLRSDRTLVRARSLRSDRAPAQARSLRSNRALARTRSLRSDRALARARSLRSDRAEHVFGCCVATLFELLSDDSCFLRKAFRKEESISKKYLSKKLAPQLVRVETLAGGLTISTKLGVLNEVYFKLRGREFSRKCSLKNIKFRAHGDKRSSDVEMGEATSPAPIPTSPVEAPTCVADHLSFREKLVRRQAKKEQVRAGDELTSSSALAVAPGHGTEGVTPRDTGTLAGSVIPDALALPAGSSTTPILVEDKERAADSMPPPPARARSLRSDRAPARAWSLRSDRALGRARSLRSDRGPGLARSLRSDRAEHVFGCCVATLLSDDSRFFRKAFS